MFGKRGERSNTQAVLCAKSRFADPKRAARWVRDHDFRADRRKDSEGDFIFEQFPEAQAEAGTLRSIGMDEGVSARVCRVKQQESSDAPGRSACESDADRETFESWLSREAT
jgi:hypothetical protein